MFYPMSHRINIFLVNRFYNVNNWCGKWQESFQVINSYIFYNSLDFESIKLAPSGYILWNVLTILFKLNMDAWLTSTKNDLISIL